VDPCGVQLADDRVKVLGVDGEPATVAFETPSHHS
jgi:hypothetical protein